MKTVLALGGAGGVGRYAVPVLLADPAVARIVIADRDEARARTFARACGDRAAGRGLDVTDGPALAAAIGEADLVVNCVGPYFRFGITVLRAAIAARRDYVDVCDDPEPTLALLALDDEARAAGIRALVGMGITPGVSNLLAVVAAGELDEVRELVTGWDLAAALPERIEREPSAATLHGVEQLSGRIRRLRGGRFVDERPITRVTLELPGVGTRSAHTIGHPEPVTLPRTFTGLRECANVFAAPASTIAGLRALRWCLDRRLITPRTAARIAERVEGAGGRTPRLADLVAAARRRRGLPLPPLFAWAKGRRRARSESVLVTVCSAPAGGIGGTTGVPLAIGASMMLAGEIDRRGVFAPEAGVEPRRFLDRLAPRCGEPRASAADLLVIMRSWEPGSLLDALAAKVAAAAGAGRG